MAYKNTCITLKKVADDEPIFVLRAQDATAWRLVIEWISINPQISKEKRQEALQCAIAMTCWENNKAAD